MLERFVEYFCDTWMLPHGILLAEKWSSEVVIQWFPKPFSSIIFVLKKKITKTFEMPTGSNEYMGL